MMIKKIKRKSKTFSLFFVDFVVIRKKKSRFRYIYIYTIKKKNRKKKILVVYEMPKKNIKSKIKEKSIKRERNFNTHTH